MPIFEYECSECGKEFEELVRSSDQAVKCPFCSCEKVEKLFSPFAGSSSSCTATSCKGCSTCG